VLLATLAALAALALLARRTAARRVERGSDRRFERDARGIIVGAEPFELAPVDVDADDAPAVLLLHGFGDTPQTLRALGEHLATEGWLVRAPLLPGHGRTIRELAASRADDWIAHARAELGALHARHRTVALCGLSMGGALATILAADAPWLPALVLIAPYVEMSALPRRLSRVNALWSIATVYVRSRGERSIEDPVERARALGHGLVTPRLVAELARVVRRAREAAPRVTAPTLVIQSRGDNRTPPSAAQAAFDRLGAREKQLLWRDRGAHVLTVDYGREDVFARAAHWLARAKPSAESRD